MTTQTRRECRPAETAPASGEALVLVGNPNVGKSLLFHRLTGQYAVVSNYPGTTVEVARGRLQAEGGKPEVIDTPGMYSLAAITDEERVAAAVLRATPARAVLHVVDAKNLGRMLGLTLQLIEAGLPVVLVLNMADEARTLGVRIDRRGLEDWLGVPVVETAATTGEGIPALISAAHRARVLKDAAVGYGPELESWVSALAAKLGDRERPAGRTRALALLQGDADEAERTRCSAAPEAWEDIAGLVARARAGFSQPAAYLAAIAVRREVDDALDRHVIFPAETAGGWAERLSRWCLRPATGLPILVAVLYFGLYQFVGRLGAGWAVDKIENGLFAATLVPWSEALARHLPWAALRDLVVGEYGLVTLGLRYAIAIILPVVGAFFLMFSLLEDSGYLPRLAMLLDRLFKRIGLNGRAVIPLVLGLGCGTMATLVTRTLETRRERLIASILLALAIPCSAQLGVILGLLAAHPFALALWGAIVVGVFAGAGAVAARFLPGPRPSFYMELPPLRLPRAGNVLTKTAARMVWYFQEILPLFLLASVLIWIGRITPLLEWLLAGLRPLIAGLGLPSAAAPAFLFGFFRRDYGAAGLYDLHRHGLLSGNQLAVAAVTLTLFLPCVAQFLVLQKERGWKTALATSAGVFGVAGAAGWLLNAALTGLGVSL